MRKRFAPWVVFGAGGNPNKVTIGYVEKGGHAAHAHICHLKKGYKYGDIVPNKELPTAVEGECVHLWFAKKDSLYYFVKSLQALYDKWNETSRPTRDEGMSNADVIRSMTDEELFAFLDKFELGDIDYSMTFCDTCTKDAALERRSCDCDGCLKWWLALDCKKPQGLKYWETEE